MRQCRTCGRIYPKALGRGGYCSRECDEVQLRRIRSYVRLRRLARMVTTDVGAPGLEPPTSAV